MTEVENNLTNQSPDEEEKKNKNSFLKSGLISTLIITMPGLCCAPLIPLGPEGIEKADTLGWVITALWIIYVPLGLLLTYMVCIRIYNHNRRKGKTPPRKLAIFTGVGIAIAIILIARLMGEFLYYL